MSILVFVTLNSPASDLCDPTPRAVERLPTPVPLPVISNPLTGPYRARSLTPPPVSDHI